ncbi:sulfotransferase domain-containing protein [Candidatus Uabimicrobium sp. HlEnr_7]|uniref:sulfotransferase domain-containing protein n=1 Tax=Candidatus Uabimicrobium helgolandensis TaxID=3095367 RepID=UPI003558D62A
MRKILFYPEIQLQDLDAGTVIIYPTQKRNLYYVVPSFLIIGAQKCGTRELHTWLSEHPNLRTSEKELHFFNEVIDIEKEWTRYIFQPWFMHSRGKKHFNKRKFYTFEKSPAYFNSLNYQTPTAEIVEQMMPSAKLVLLLRNPTDRAYSAYQMGKRNTRFREANKSSQQSFATLIKRKMECIEEKPSDLIDLGHYSLYLQRWLDVFPRENIFIIFLEEFKQEPVTVMKNLLSFLELPPLDYTPFIEKNFRGLWVIKNRSSKGNRKPYKSMSKEAKEILDEHYSSWNEKLKKLLPDRNIPWS